MRPVAHSDPRSDQGDVLRFGQLLLERFGLYFSEGRRAQLEAGVQHAFVNSGFASLDEYYEALLRDANAIEVERLVNALTVSESHFFRDARQFDVLFALVLPELIKRRRAERRLRIWSAGCAGGEEPYSLAMMLREQVPDVEEWAITLLATDVNTDALTRAREAVYSDWAFREAHARRWCPRYFDGEQGRYVLHPDLRRMVTFAQLNLTEFGATSTSVDTSEMDLILCRNVMIYLHDQLIHPLLDRFYDALAEGGWLLVGQSEPSLITYRRFETHSDPRTVLYRRALTSVAPDDQRPVQNTAVKRDESIADLSEALDHARMSLESGQAQEAHDMLMSLSAAQLREAEVQTLLGRVYVALERWQDAEQICCRVLQVNRLARDAYYTLAQTLEQQGRLDEALPMLKKVIFIDRRHVLGHWRLAHLYYHQGRMAQARKSLDNVRLLLETRDANEVLPCSSGLSVARLQQMVTQQQQTWRMESQSMERT